MSYREAMNRKIKAIKSLSEIISNHNCFIYLSQGRVELLFNLMAKLSNASIDGQSDTVMLENLISDEILYMRNICVANGWGYNENTNKIIK